MADEPPSAATDHSAPPATPRRVRLLCRGGRGNVAMIDSQIVREGDRFDGAAVVEIRGDGVVLEGGPADLTTEADRPLAPAR